MPIINVPIPEVAQTVSRPILTDIIRQITRITGIPDDVRILFPGESGHTAVPGTALSDATKQLPTTNTDNITIEVDEAVDENFFGTNAVNQIEHIPVFMDTKLDLIIRPIYYQTAVTVNVRYQSSSKTTATRWRDSMIVKLSEFRDINLHDIRYHYSIPRSVYDLLAMVFTLREEVAGYGDMFEEYMKSNSSERLTVIGDIVGKTRQLAISETQGRIVGWFDYSTEPDKIEKNDDGSFTAGFSYRFSYQKPVYCNIQYPIIVHNQLIDEIYVEHLREYNEDDIRKSFSTSLGALNYFESQNAIAKTVNASPLIRIPDTDFIVLDDPPRAIGNYMQILSTVEEDQKTLFNVQELGDIVIDADILTFMLESEYPYMTKLYRSILSCFLYKQNRLSRDDSLVMNAQGVIAGTEPLDLRVSHRVVLGVVLDLTLLDEDAIRRLMKYPKAFLKILISINDIMSRYPKYLELIGKRKLSEKDLRDLYSWLTGKTPVNGGNIFYDLLANLLNQRKSRTVMATYIQAHHLTEYKDGNRRA